MSKAFEKILERLEELQNNLLSQTEGNIDLQVGIINGVMYSKKIVQEVAEEYNDGWIPCSERLPGVEADVLLSLRSLDIHTGFMSNTEGYFYVDGEGYVEFENVLAWQPLPKPFKERD